MRRLLPLILVFGAGGGEAGPVAGGYQEAVFSVSDAEGFSDFLGEVGGWQMLAEGDVDNRLLAAWGLPATATAREIVVGNPGTERGYVRLLQFGGVAQQQIRSGAQPWDTGGFFDVNARVLDMAARFREFQADNWQGYSDPVQFGFGPFEVIEWLTRGPDGIVFALIERIRPPLEGWPELRLVSRLFNATQIVADLAAAREFYVGKLGFEVYLEHDGPSEAPGPNVLGLPHNLAGEVTRRVAIVHPQGSNEGSIELLEFVGLTGADFSARATPPNLGILMLRFPVADMGAFQEHVAAVGIDVVMPPIRVELPPLGRVELMALRGPGGVWLEFYEQEQYAVE